MLTRRSILLALALVLPLRGISGQALTAPQSVLDIEIVVPAFRLDVRRDARVVQSFPVAVGMPRYPTPIGDFAITEIEWNPWWYPPDSPWARNDTVTPPGPRNPMGRVKMLLGGPLFVHGTPLPASIGKAASHSCVRMRNEDAITLARMLQVHTGTPVSEAAIDSLLQRGRPTRRIALPSPVPVRIVYRLVELRGDELAVHPDIYRRGRHGIENEALALLAAAGYDTITVDRALLRRVVGEATRATVRVTIPRLRNQGLAPAPALSGGGTAPYSDSEGQSIPRPRGCGWIPEAR